MWCEGKKQSVFQGNHKLPVGGVTRGGLSSLGRVWLSGARRLLPPPGKLYLRGSNGFDYQSWV